MTLTQQKKWTLASILGLAYWFYGNLYEAIVFSPNWIHDSPAQMKRLNEFFVHTSPAVYFIPITVIAVFILWFLNFKNKVDSIKRDYRMASVYAFIVMVLTVCIVTCVLSKMFGSGFYQNPGEVNLYCWAWNILNILRIVLVVITTYYVFNAYRKLDKMG
jgi:hypothetical protein